MDKKNPDDRKWKQKLSSLEYHILREAGTEAPFSGALWNHKEEGVYLCAACGHRLFHSEAKYDSGTGWPSFWQPIDSFCLILAQDSSLRQTRTEVRCAQCGSHLGHVFDDGPPPSGKRYCINSAALRFTKEEYDS